MDNLFGNNPVSGSNFYGRQKFVKQLVSLLTKGNSFLLLGLRRIGKSSVIEEVKRRIVEANEIEVVFLNCQTYQGIEDFYKELFLSLPRDLGERLSRYLSSTKRIPKKIIDSITDYIEEFKAPGGFGVKLRNDILDYANPLRIEISNFFLKEQKRIILFIDELPFMFETISKSNKQNYVLEIESVLTTLRHWRNSKVSMAVCGSINLHQQLEELGISRKLLAGLVTQKLPAYTREEAKGLLNVLHKNHKLDMSEEVIEEILNRLPDYVPNFIQFFFHCVQNYEGKLDAGIIGDIYKEAVFPHLFVDFIYQFQDRLKAFKGADYKTAKKILTYISQNQPSSNNEILNNVEAENTYQILVKLMDYEFITMNRNLKYSFSLNVIKNWWEDFNQ